MVGATVIESEDTGPVSLRSALELLGAAYALHPGFAEAAIVELGSGLRPAFPTTFPAPSWGDRRIFVNGAPTGMASCWRRCSPRRSPITSRPTRRPSATRGAVSHGAPVGTAEFGVRRRTPRSADLTFSVEGRRGCRRPPAARAQREAVGGPELRAAEPRVGRTARGRRVVGRADRLDDRADRPRRAASAEIASASPCPGRLAIVDDVERAGRRVEVAREPQRDREQRGGEIGGAGRRAALVGDDAQHRAPRRAAGSSSGSWRGAGSPPRRCAR